MNVPNADHLGRFRTPATLPLSAGALLAAVAVGRYLAGAYGGATAAAGGAIVCFAFAAVVE